jgi:class 3 adenylate cyclase
LPIGKLLLLPEKAQVVIEFEGLSEKAKEKIRDSHQWPEIAEYYNEYHRVIQHNVAEHAWRQQIGYEIRGVVQYVGKTFVKPLSDPSPDSEKWEKGPDRFWHMPGCEYRLTGYTDLKLCRCHRGRLGLRKHRKED